MKLSAGTIFRVNDSWHEKKIAFRDHLVILRDVDLSRGTLPWLRGEVLVSVFVFAPSGIHEVYIYEEMIEIVRGANE